MRSLHKINSTRSFPMIKVLPLLALLAFLAPGLASAAGWPPDLTKVYPDWKPGEELLEPIPPHVMRQMTAAVLELADGSLTHVDDLLAMAQDSGRDLGGPLNNFYFMDELLFGDHADDGLGGISSTLVVLREMQRQREKVSEIASRYSHLMELANDSITREALLNRQTREAKAIHEAVNWLIGGRLYALYLAYAVVPVDVTESVSAFQYNRRRLAEGPAREAASREPGWYDDLLFEERAARMEPFILRELRDPRYAQYEKELVDREVARFMEGERIRHTAYDRMSVEFHHFMDATPLEWAHIPFCDELYALIFQTVWPWNLPLPEPMPEHRHYPRPILVYAHRPENVITPYATVTYDEDLFRLYLVSKVALRPPPYAAPPALELSMGSTAASARPGDPLHVGVRVTNRGRTGVAAVTLSVQLYDHRTGLPLESWKPVSGRVVNDDHSSFFTYVDGLEANEALEIVLQGSAGEAETLLWVAQWHSAGEAAGRRQASGRITPSHAAAILDVLVLDPQLSMEDGVYSVPYPFVPERDNLDSTVEHRPTTRGLFVVGRNLPQKVGDEHVLTSDDPHVKYRILAFPDRDHQIWRDHYESAWRRYSGGRSKSAAPTSLQGLLVSASFQEGVLPGEKVLRLNDSAGHWDLRFGDLTGTIAFVREAAPGRIEVIEHAYFPERVRIAVTTSEALPLTEIAVDLLTSGEGFTKRQTQSLTATRAPDYGPNVYLTPPIRLLDHRRKNLSAPPSGEAGELGLAVNRSELHLAIAFARVSDAFARQFLSIKMSPSQAELRLRRTPATGDNSHQAAPRHRDVFAAGGVAVAAPSGRRQHRSHLWKDALRRAAAVHDIEIQDWSEDGRVVVEELSNTIVLTREDHFLEENVLLGHHAAMLLMRDVFEAMTRREIVALGEIRGDDRAVRGFLSYMRRFWLNDDFPVNRLVVEGPDGKDVRFNFVLVAEARDFSTAERTFTAEEIDRWRVRAAKEALAKLQEAAAESIEMAADIEDDEIEDLLKLTGIGFDAVRDHLSIRLMRLQDSTDATGARYRSWVPDHEGRNWVRRVALLAARVKKQQAAARVDNHMLVAAAALLTAPLLLSESVVVALIALSIDALDLALTTSTEISEYRESLWEQQFSAGAAITIGYERNKAAVADAKGWVSTTFAVGTSAFGAISGVLDVVAKASKVRLARRVARGRQIAEEIDPARLGSLSQRARDDFLIFLIDAKARALARGGDALDGAQRRALAVVETISAERKAAGVGTRTGDTPVGVDVVPMRRQPDPGGMRLVSDDQIVLKRPVVRPHARAPPAAAQTDASPLRIDASRPEFDASLVTAIAGTPVTDPRPFGMLAEAMRHFQDVVNRYGLRVRVRDANPSSMRWLRQGHPPKHVKLKSKTINDLDVELGARPGSQGMVGYFLPRRPRNYEALSYEELSELKPKSKLVKRYLQRVKGYLDNFEDIERLKEKGLVSVEHGVVIDRGLGSMRLDLKSGSLVPIRGPPGGTGKGFTGNYDMWDITYPSGARIITDPDHPHFDADAAQRKAELFRELAAGKANVQHGPHKDWEPFKPSDRAIDQKIRDGHRGQRLPDGRIGPMPGSKGLVEFQPRTQPRVSYEYDAPTAGFDAPTVPVPIPAARRTSFTDGHGQTIELRIGPQVGKRRGATSVAYEHPDFPRERVVRVTTEKPGHPAVRLDDFGRRALERDISSPHIRTAKEFERWDVADASAGFSRVSVVERVVPLSESIRSTGGVMTRAQQGVFESALRDLNRQGYVWLDNKWDNFGFVENSDGSLTIVVFDTGGIFKISDNAGNAAQIARQIQLCVNGPLEIFAPNAIRFRLAYRVALRRDEIRDKYLHAFDMDGMGLTDFSQLKFTPISGEQFDYVGRSFAR